jgi:hypothetical protein
MGSCFNRSRKSEASNWLSKSRNCKRSSVVNSLSDATAKQAAMAAVNLA